MLRGPFPQRPPRDPAVRRRQAPALRAASPLDGIEAQACRVAPVTVVGSPSDSAACPLDLLEDDGVTDIHGSIDQYSYKGVNTVPEPSPVPLLSCVMAALGLIRKQRQRTKKYGG